MTDSDIEAAAKKAGARWSGDAWIFEDANLHPFARALFAAERERCAKLCEDISEEFQRTEGRRHPELKSDAQEGAATCADRIRLGA